MTKHSFRKLVDRKTGEAEKHNRLIYLGAKNGDCLNAYDLIKEEYMRGKHGLLTERQLELVCDRCNRKGHGAVC